MMVFSGSLSRIAATHGPRSSFTPSRGFGSRPFEPFLVRFLAAREADQVGVAPLVDHLGELAHVGADRQVGVIDAAELVGVGVDVDERLAGMVGRDERVAVGRRFAEPRADGEDQIGVADALLELRVGAVAELAGIDLAVLQIASWRRKAAATGMP